MKTKRAEKAKTRKMLIINSWVSQKDILSGMSPIELSKRATKHTFQWVRVKA